MALHTAEAIVLRRYPFRETSVTLSCLTDQFGKLKGLVKGLRRQPNRYQSAMEPLTINRITFYDTRTSQLHLISQCDLVDPLMAIQQDLPTAQVAAFCVDLVDTVVPLEDPQPATYRLLRQTLHHLALGGNDLDWLRIYFVVRVLHLAGFRPRLDHCTGCDAVVHDQGYWSVKQGGLVCERCLHTDPQAEKASPEALHMLDALAQAEEPLVVVPTLIPLLRRRLDDFLRWHLERPLKTMAY
jgi:DNA repair protein RecO (recombination protein O)